MEQTVPAHPATTPVPPVPLTPTQPASLAISPQAFGPLQLERVRAVRNTTITTFTCVWPATTNAKPAKLQQPTASPAEPTGELPLSASAPLATTMTE